MKSICIWKLLHSYSPRITVNNLEEGLVTFLKVILFNSNECTKSAFLSHHKHENNARREVLFILFNSTNQPQTPLCSESFCELWDFLLCFLTFPLSSLLFFHRCTTLWETIGKEIPLATRVFPLDTCMGLVVEWGWC